MMTTHETTLHYDAFRHVRFTRLGPDLWQCDECRDIGMAEQEAAVFFWA